jgi:sodium-dependent dicarboxylate transporter 2/3/5
LVSIGPIKKEEKIVLAIFMITAFCWVSRSFLLQRFIPAIDDTIIALIAGISLFVIPSTNPKEPLIKWEEAVKIPWGIMLLFGGGMALAKGFEATGLANWLGTQMTLLQGVSLLVLLFVIIASVNFITEVTSNLATTAMLLPILYPLAVTMNINPYLLLVASTVSASSAFMLPVATPPNAVIFGSGYLKISDMIKAGIWMNIISIVLITVMVYFLLPLIWGFDPTVFSKILKLD